MCRLRDRPFCEWNILLGNRLVTHPEDRNEILIPKARAVEGLAVVMNHQTPNTYRGV